ncbi:MAG TPA: sulfurtransferase TusA family protein [Stellaceae bacterium]|nr:sulfurtransferase TusA family protein [Stellaceae bacterium]
MDIEDGAAVVELDARGLNCPLPVLKARKLFKTVPAGGYLRVLATDPGAPKDFEHFCATTGATLIGVDMAADHTVITLKR